MRVRDNSERYIHKPLPWLPVVQDIYCSQAMTDACISYMEKNRPDLLEDLHEMATTRSYEIETELWGMDEYFQEEAKVGRVVAPEEFLARIDLIFEIIRRFERRYGFAVCCRKQDENGESVVEWTPPVLIHDNPADPAYEIQEYVIRENPIADHPGGAYLPMPNLEISARHKEGGLTQELADTILQPIYAAYPKLWYERAEAERREVNVFHGKPDVWDYIADVVKDKFGDPHYKMKEGRLNHSLTHMLSNEATRRIRHMCGLRVWT